MKSFRILLFSLILIPLASPAYDLPAGIPNPATYGPSPFGWEIDRPTPSWPASWIAQSPSATEGFYFVDNSDPNATDNSNPYGHPGSPRKTWPSMHSNKIAPGSFIYIHGGTYNVGNTGRTNHGVSSLGTQTSPIWFSGNPNNPPTLENQSFKIGEITTGASYWIFENLNMTRSARFEMRPSGTSPGVDHIIVRNCALEGSNSLSDPSGVTVGGGKDGANNPLWVTYVVILNCVIHNFGKADNDPVVDGGASEQAGVYNDWNRKYTWILDSTVYDVGADCIAGSHNANDTTLISEYVFVGRCTLAHPDPQQITSGENCIDFKATRYVVVSECYMRGTFGREQGWLAVIHSGGWPVPVRDCWFLFNTLHHGSAGIVSSSTNGARDVGVVGNLIYDIKDSYGVVSDSWNGAAIRHGQSQGAGNYIVHNTLNGYEDGITLNGLDEPNSFCRLHGNILSNRTDEAGYDFDVQKGQELFIDSDYNFWPSSTRVKWANKPLSLGLFRAASNEELHGLAGDPMFVNTGITPNYSLKDASPAKDASVEGAAGASAYDAFEAIFGVPIKRDINGTPRPLNGAWDMGAFEFNSGHAPQAPSPPTGVRVIPK